MKVFLANQKNKVISLLVWLCITFFYCYQYILRVLPNVIMPKMISKYSITAHEYGSFAGIYYIGYVLVHIPIGFLLSKFGSKIILPICIILTVVGLIPFVYLDRWEYVVIGRFLIGVGSSAAIIGALQTFRILYKNFSQVLGLMISLSLIVIVYCIKLLNIVIAKIGLNYMFHILILLGVTFAFITYFLLPKSVETNNNNSLLLDIKYIVTNSKILLTSLCAGLMVGPLEGFADAWGSIFLINVYGLDKIGADLNITYILLGMSIGCIIVPYIVEKTNSYFLFTIIAAIGMFLLFCFLFSKKVTYDSLLYVCLGIGFFCSYQTVIVPKIATFSRKESSAFSLAVANMIIMLFGWIFHNLIGFIIDFLWDNQMINGIKIYSGDILIKSFLVIPIAMGIAILLLVYLALFKCK